ALGAPRRSFLRQTLDIILTVGEDSRPRDSQGGDYRSRRSPTILCSPPSEELEPRARKRYDVEDQAANRCPASAKPSQEYSLHRGAHGHKVPPVMTSTDLRSGE